MFTEALLGLVLAAQAAPGAPTVEDVRATSRALLQSICGYQCDVIDVAIKTKALAPTGAVAPGFDEAPASRKTASEIALRLLFDKKLTADQRRFATERLRHRIGEYGLPVTVSEEVMAFPPRPTPPEEPKPPEPQIAPPAPQPQPAQQPQPVIVQAPAAPAPAPVDPMEALVLRLIEAIPLLLLAGLLAWTVMRVLKRLESLAGVTYEAEPPPAPEAAKEAPAPAVAAPAPPVAPAPPSVEELADALGANRGGTRRVFRGLVVRGDLDTVALAVATLGDFVVRDLRHDPSLRAQLGALGRRMAQVLSTPIEGEARDEMLRQVRAELTADGVGHGAQDVRKELEGLYGFGPDAFSALVGRLSKRLAVVLLRHAPPHLTEAYLAGLASRERTETVERLILAPPATPEEIAAIARELEVQSEAALLGGEEAERIFELLDAVPASEQDALVVALETARPDFVRRNLGQLPIESALLRVPENAIQAAWAAVPFEEWVAYLRVAPAAIQARCVGACPSRLREGLAEELRLRVAGDPIRGADARRRIVRAALQAAPVATNGAAGHAKSVETTVVSAVKEETKV